MNKTRFLKPPLSPVEKEKKAEEFLNFTSTKDSKDNKPIEKEKVRVLKKEPVKAMALRFPRSLAEDIAEISAMSGLSINSVCVELLRPSVKNKLKELKE